MNLGGGGFPCGRPASYAQAEAAPKLGGPLCGWPRRGLGRRTAPGLTDIGGNAAPAPKVPLPFSYIRFSPSTMICPVRGVS